VNVLVVDDEPMVLRAEIRCLEAAGHRCHAANSCAGALEVLRRETIDVALLDVRMPGEDGLVLARTIQRDHSDVVVIMVTGTADFSSVSDARLAGAVDYLMKPASAADLAAAVNRAAGLSQRRMSREAREPLASASASPGAVRRPAVASLKTMPMPPDSTVPSTPATDPPIDLLFRAMRAAGASDLHLSAGVPPLIRMDGEIMPLDADGERLTAEGVVQLLNPIVPGKNRKQFEETHDSDFAYEIDGLCRFRGNIFTDRKGMAAVFRVVPTEIVTAEALGLSADILQLCALRKGLVLVTGPTGSGKSTTLAALIDYINRTRSEHIVTIEDPIEFVHDNQRCLVNQREVHSHTRSFKAALRAALREDPDVVLIGEMRDLETISIALETAETGHLVFGTLHTSTASSTVDRIIDQFPANRQSQIRVMLSESLQGIIAQTLCRRVAGGRIAALEVLLVTTAVSNLIREGKTFQIPSMMQMGRANGMVTLNDALLSLVQDGIVAADEAHAKAIDKASFTVMLERNGLAAVARP
jgi:twitching motility protein PilT